jgi:pimeloyl-ACP methyl ester carboxylesterase
MSPNAKAPEEPRMRSSCWRRGEHSAPSAQRQFARTRDGWRIALHRYLPPDGAHATPVILCHGMGSNRFNLDGPRRNSLARFLHARGYDAWLIELRGAGESRRRLRLPPVPRSWSFEDYVHHDVPAALRLVRRETGAERVLWVGHSLGGMVAYGVLMTPVGDAIAGAVTLASPGMTDVGHERIDRFAALRVLLRLAPPMIPVRVAAWLGAPLAGPLARVGRQPIADLAWHPDNLDLDVMRFMMRHGVEDISRALLIEFARWYDARRMSDRYDLYSFSDHLERIRAPMLVVAGAKDRLTPPEDLRCVAERIGSADKRLVVAGRDTGFAHDYSHVDLVLGRHAPDEIYPLVGDWLDAHRPAA